VRYLLIDLSKWNARPRVQVQASNLLWLCSVFSEFLLAPTGKDSESQSKPTAQQSGFPPLHSEHHAFYPLSCLMCVLLQFFDEKNAARGANRYATMLTFLETVEEGGETVFTKVCIFCCAFASYGY
jgi:hypothetical protein